MPALSRTTCGCPGRASAELTPPQEAADDVAERAVAHPREPDALLLAAFLLTRPTFEAWYDAEVRAHARTLLLAAVALPAPGRPAATEQLRRRCERVKKWVKG